MEQEHKEYIDNYEDAESLINELVTIGNKAGNDLIKKRLHCEMSTPYSCATKLDRKFDPIKGRICNFNEKDEVKQMFIHYDVNPSVEENKKKILETYVTEFIDNVPELKDVYKANKNGINPIFYNDIIKVIDQLKNGNTNSPEDQYIYLTGIRGSGKTGFLNYFISSKEEELNNRKIISVRVNVMRIKDDVTINEAIEYKLCRILFTYYCSWEKKIDRLKNRKIKNYIDHILIDFCKHSRYKELDIHQCHEYFCTHNSKVVKKIKKEYSDLCRDLLNELSKDYKFIVMLDNFDQLSPNEKGKNDYARRNKELEDLQSEWISSHSVFIISVRYSTYRNMTFPGKKKPAIWSIGTPSTYNMIQKRIDYHIKNNNSLDGKKEERINFVVDIIKSIGCSFISTSANDVIDFEKACNEIDSIYSGNKRIIMNIITRFIDSLGLNNKEGVALSGIIKTSFLTKNSYKFFESLLVDIDTGYCKSFYMYELDNNKLKISNMNGEAHHENNFAPNLYFFPCVEDEELMFMPFLKIRILQLLSNSKKALKIRKICEILKRIFSYSEDAINIACLELREDQSLILKDDNLYELTSEQSDKTALRITDRGKKMLEITPHNINILAVSLERIFIPEDLLDSGMPIANYFGESQEAVNESKQFSDSTSFIINNIFCSLPKIVGLFEAIEKYEFQKKFENDTENNYFTSSDFTITQKLIQKMKTDQHKIFNSFFMPSSNNSTNEAVFNGRRKDLCQQLIKCIDV